MSFRKTTISLSVFLLATMIAVRPASAACTNASLAGVFGYFHGRLAGPGVPHGVVGQITADGKGNLSGLFTMSKDGAISAGTFTGTYSISKNCTGSLTFSDEVLAPTNFNIVLDDAKKGFQMILSDNNTTEPGFGVAQGTVTCGLTGKKLTLATNLFGTLTSSGDPAAAVGQITLDGKGNISGAETFSVDYTILALPVSGTYTENSNCTGTAQITPQGASVTNFSTIVVNGGKELLLIETDSGTLIAGNAQQ